MPSFNCTVPFGPAMIAPGEPAQVARKPHRDVVEPQHDCVGKRQLDLRLLPHRSQHPQVRNQPAARTDNRYLLVRREISRLVQVLVDRPFSAPAQTAHPCLHGRCACAAPGGPSPSTSAHGPLPVRPRYSTATCRTICSITDRSIDPGSEFENTEPPHPISKPA